VAIEPNRTIVVVIYEDSEKDARLIEGELNRTGLDVSIEKVFTRESFDHALSHFRPDLIITDHALGSENAGEPMSIARQFCPAAPIIMMISTMDPHSIAEAIRGGAEDVLLSTDLRSLPSVIDRALEVRRGVGKLSPRQLQVLRLVAEGFTTPEIAAQLNLSGKTIETHRGEVMKRLGIHDLATLVRFAIRVGLVPLH
jgi:DNA-binding NarL/FixJ family response regulator